MIDYKHYLSSAIVDLFIQIDDTLSCKTLFKVRRELTSSDIDRQVRTVLEHVRGHGFDCCRDLNGLKLWAIAEYSEIAGDHHPCLVEINRLNELPASRKCQTPDDLCGCGQDDIFIRSVVSS